MGLTYGWLVAVVASVLWALGVPGCVTDPGYEPPIECPTGFSDCNRSCVDVLIDAANCGTCGTACGTDALCGGGACLCGGGLTSCESGCADLTTDPDHCGACGTQCAEDELCSGGSCVENCPQYQTECGRSCVEVSSDPRHCGDCNEACSTGRACIGGRCACASGTEECDGKCVDIGSDPQHCGSCDFACAGAEVCRGGRCACPGGTSACDGGCADLFSDAEHCGACGNVCAADEVCSMGRCQKDCERLTPCGRSCVDTSSSEAHCGECNAACEEGQMCVQGACACPAGRTLCDEACVDLQADSRHCGSCGLDCAPDQRCRAGQCECPAGSVLCGTACVNLEESPAHCGECNAQCAATEVCSSGICTAECNEGEQLCGSSCVDVQTSSAHCGDCAEACAPHLSCSAGSCECPSGATPCGGSCVDTSSSAAHCGQCDQACDSQQTCSAGQCVNRPDCSEDACEHPSGIRWGCQRRFMYGVNYGWEQFAGDFGGISAWDAPGVAENAADVDARLGDMAAHGVSVVRWWVWPDFRGDGVRFDASGTPAGLGPTVFADLEKALELADAHNLHLMLTLFSFDNFRPSRTTQDNFMHGMQPIATDSARRLALIERVVRPFARAAEQSEHRERLIAWDVINEPEWAMHGPSKYCSDDELPANDGLEHLTHDEMELFVSDVIRGLRAESSALVTVGGAATLWRCAWKYVDIDFYQFHIYDWVDDWAPYDQAPGFYGIVDKPAVMGEFPMNGLSRASYGELVDYWYENGWAGALGWAVTDRGFDWDGSKAAVGAFSDEHSCETHY